MCYNNYNVLMFKVFLILAACLLKKKLKNVLDPFMQHYAEN